MPETPEHMTTRSDIDASPAQGSTKTHFGSAALGLFLLTLLVYLPTFSANFVTLDDPQYVLENTHIRHPTWDAARRFFAEVKNPSTVAGYYQPLTMISLMTDAWIIGGDGRDPFIYHATNVLLHALNAVLVLVIMRMIFGGTMIPLILAAFFALHPVQVESVAWISQRKTVLASFFALASIAAYLRYGKSRQYRYLTATFLLLLLGNLAKPTLMLLPLTLILLDIWPLKRPVLRALPEKLPFLALMLLAAWVAWVSQASAASLGMPKLGGDRFLKWVGLLSYNLMLYLGNIVWPMHLSPYRGVPTDLSIGNPLILGSIAGALAFGLVVAAAWKWSRPFFVGAIGFGVVLLPALGGVRFAASCVSDRFLYLPFVFLLMPLGALARRLTRVLPRKTRLIGACMALFTIPLVILTWAQQPVWQSSRNLWFHIHSAVPDLAKANYNVALFHYDEGQYEASRDAAARAVESEPRTPKHLHVLGASLTRLGEPERALPLIQQALEMGLGRKQAQGYISLAEAHIAMGDAEQAQRAVEQAAALGEDSARSLARIGRVAMEQARNCDWAIEYYRAALSKDPDILDLRYELANILRACGRRREALLEYEEYIARARQRGLNVQQQEQAARQFHQSIERQSAPP